MTPCPQATALAVADAVLASKGRSFHWARRLLSPRHAARATRLYSFCRYIDDLADEASSVESARINLKLVSRALVRGHSNHPVVADGIALMQECSIEPAVFHELIAGMVSDLGLVRIKDEGELLRYCYRVAGTVGLMMCKVLDTQDPRALAHAVDLGIAMQLTNICRDITADAMVGRRYLPACLVGEISPDALVMPVQALHLQLQKCVAHLLDIADRYYRSGELGLAYLPAGARSGILVAARVYRAIGCRLRARDNAYWQGRVIVPTRVKLAVTTGALLSAPLRPSFWLSFSPHDDSLHEALSGLRGLSSLTPAKAPVHARGI
jgi:phytoene synthase